MSLTPNAWHDIVALAFEAWAIALGFDSLFGPHGATSMKDYGFPKTGAGKVLEELLNEFLDERTNSKLSRFYQQFLENSRKIGFMASLPGMRHLASEFLITEREKCLKQVKSTIFPLAGKIELLVIHDIFTYYGNVLRTMSRKILSDAKKRKMILMKAPPWRCSNCGEKTVNQFEFKNGEFVAACRCGQKILCV